jgi:cytochrome c oxidase cbb3-type subunit 2
MPLRKLALLLPVVLAGAVAGLAGELSEESDLRARVAALEREQQEATTRRGAKLFARSCAACHGRFGRGDGPGANDLEPRPRDLTSTHYRFRTTESGSMPSTADLRRTIRRGLPASSMPGFGDLFSDRELEELITFVQSLHGREPTDPVTIGELPSATAVSVAEGRSLYLLMGCWTCHGKNGSGHGPSAPMLTDSDGRRIRTTDFRHDPLKGGHEPEDVVRTLITGLNGAPMPSYADAVLFACEDFPGVSAFEDHLSTGEIDQLAAYVAAIACRADLNALAESDRTTLRDRRLAALAHYVLSLDRRRTLGSWLFRQKPEREARP